MVDQTLPEIVAVHESNKAKRNQALKEQKKKETEKILNDMMDKLSKIKRDCDNCNDPAIKQTIYNDWINLVKLYAKKIDE